MPVKTKIQKRKAKNIISTPSKINLWLRAFLDETNPRTFMNRVESVKAAGYRCASEEAFRAMGSSVYQRCQPVIAGWLDEVGLSEPSLKLKALSLLSARETKFEKIKGTVDPSTLPENVSVVTTTDIHTMADGAPTTLSGETLLSIGVNALETQRKTLDMAFRVRGMYRNPDLERLNDNLNKIFLLPHQQQSEEQWEKESRKLLESQNPSQPQPIETKAIVDRRPEKK